MATVGITHCRKIEDYRQAILHAGGEVLVLDPETAPDDPLEGIGGLLLTGGADVAPARYGETPDPTVVDVEPERDAFEIGLVKAARARGLPILAICRGIQLMNVAFGGSLIQDIPTQVAGALDHSLKPPKHQAYDLAHEVWVEKDSLLARLLVERLAGADTCDVNSRHHQAVKAVAPGFRVTATAPDGVVEALEDPAARFCLGVQWHPENFWRTGEFRAIFEGFLEEAARPVRG
jgi:putative glutamine amidotransferase